MYIVPFTWNRPCRVHLHRPCSGLKVDAEDHARTLSNKEKVRAFLLKHGSASNHRLRGIGGSRAMARAWELQTEYAAENPVRHVVTIRRIKGSEWEVRLDMVPLGRDASTRINQKPLPLGLPF